MNIFVTSDNPVECARVLDDRRLVKMCLETAQLLSTAVRLAGWSGTEDYRELYKATHANHPCARWVRMSDNNFEWTYAHGLALCREYYDRYHRVHACLKVINSCGSYRDVFLTGSLTEFVNCTDIENDDDVFRCYRKYLVAKWTADGDKAKWTNRKPPEWSMWGVKQND